MSLLGYSVVKEDSLSFKAGQPPRAEGIQLNGGHPRLPCHRDLGEQPHRASRLPDLLPRPRLGRLLGHVDRSKRHGAASSFFNSPET